MMDSRDEALLAARIELQSELMSGESLLWVGKPSLKIIFHKQDWFAIPFSFMWGGFAIFWEHGANGGRFPHTLADISFFSLWGIPFVLLGQYLIWVRFIFDAWKKTKVVYGVTNKRALVLISTSGKKLIDGYWSGLQSVTLTERKDGFGTIEFDNGEIFAPFFSSRNRNQQISLKLESLAFIDIADVKTVYQIVQSQRQKERLQVAES
jgi:hypothetical protein